VSAQPSLYTVMTRHSVLLERLKAGQTKKLDAFLREQDRAIRAILTRDGIGEYRRERLENLLAEINAILLGINLQFTRSLESDLRELAAHEGSFAVRALEVTGLTVALPTAGALWAAARTDPLQVQGANKGKLLESFIKDWSDGQREAVTGAIRAAVAQGQTIGETVTAIRGTKAANYADGLLAIQKRQAEAVIRTAVAHVGDAARRETYGMNADIVKGEMWSSTLDNRTTDICMSLDGRIFELDKGPRPPAHVNCRSVMVPVLNDEFAFLSKGAKRSSPDGPVDARLTYFEWLKTQPAAFQDEALGRTKAALFREGGLSADRFAALQLDRNFNPLTLAEMRTLEPLAFQKAGL